MKATRFYPFVNSLGRETKVRFALDEYADGTLALYKQFGNGRRSTISWYVAKGLANNETYIDQRCHPKSVDVLLNNDVAVKTGRAYYDDEGTAYPLLRFNLSKFKERNS